MNYKEQIPDVPTSAVSVVSTTSTLPPPPKKPSPPEKKPEPTQILGYGPAFPEKLFERLQLKVEMPATIRLRFQLTKSVIISFIPDGSQAIGILESGDWIRSIDGTKIESRRKVYTLLKQKTKTEAYTVIFLHAFKACKTAQGQPELDLA
uniref:PDZ domain-containing protein n=1 Tax=Panagrolaimus sp. ES5 TaxID=591445 RepID=A0AC34F9W3_9BILA